MRRNDAVLDRSGVDGRSVVILPRDGVAAPRCREGRCVGCFTGYSDDFGSPTREGIGVLCTRGLGRIGVRRNDAVLDRSRINGRPIIVLPRYGVAALRCREGRCVGCLAVYGCDFGIPTREGVGVLCCRRLGRIGVCRDDAVLYRGGVDEVAFVIIPGDRVAVLRPNGIEIEVIGNADALPVGEFDSTIGGLGPADEMMAGALECIFGQRLRNAPAERLRVHLARAFVRVEGDGERLPRIIDGDLNVFRRHGAGNGLRACIIALYHGARHGIRRVVSDGLNVIRRRFGIRFAVYVVDGQRVAARRIRHGDAHVFRGHRAGNDGLIGRAAGDRRAFDRIGSAVRDLRDVSFGSRYALRNCVCDSERVLNGHGGIGRGVGGVACYGDDFGIPSREGVGVLCSRCLGRIGVRGRLAIRDRSGVDDAAFIILPCDGVETGALRVRRGIGSFAGNGCKRRRPAREGVNMLGTRGLCGRIAGIHGRSAVCYLAGLKDRTVLILEYDIVFPCGLGELRSVGSVSGCGWQ